MPDIVVIKGLEVERVDTYKYPNVFDNGLCWKENTNNIVKNAHSRLFCLRKLRPFDISPKMLQMSFTCSVLSVLTISCVCWGGNIYNKG